MTDHFPLTFAVFVGVYVASKLEPRFGAADGKLMVGLAAFAPVALAVGIILELVVFVLMRLRQQKDAALAGALWLYLGAVLTVMLFLIWVPRSA